MTIVEDKAQQEGKHQLKHDYFEGQGIGLIRLPLPVGDYVLMNDKIEDVIKRKGQREIDVKKMDLLGTYNVAVDTKFSIQELCADICGPQHDRFRDECILAQNNNIKLIVLVENEGGLIPYTQNIYNQYISDLEFLHRWKNERLFVMDKETHRQKYPRATKGYVLQKSAMTMAMKYGVQFLFCKPGECGKKIIELLS